MTKFKSGIMKPPPPKKEYRSFTIKFTPDHPTDAMAFSYNGDMSDLEILKGLYALNKIFINKLMDQYIKETGDTTGDDDKFDKWVLEKQK